MNKVRYAVPNAFTSLNFLMGTFAIALAPLGKELLFKARADYKWGPAQHAHRAKVTMYLSAQQE